VGDLEIDKRVQFRRLRLLEWQRCICWDLEQRAEGGVV